MGVEHSRGKLRATVSFFPGLGVVVWAAAMAAGVLCAARSKPAGSKVPPPAIKWAPRHYVCMRGWNLSIDGALLEDAWQLAPWTEEFVDIEGEHKQKPRFQTRAKMLWDDSCFYVGAELREPDLWATLRQRDTVIFRDNDFEVFIDPDGDTHLYYELEVNALGTAWDLLLPKPYRDGGPAVNAWDIRGLRVGVRLEGTLNNPTDEDSGWTVEIAMPWVVLSECAAHPGPPLPGEYWRVNFSRVEWHTEVRGGRYEKVKDPKTQQPLPEDNWVWSPQGVINMHYPEMWGFVHFCPAPAGSALCPFSVPEHERTKWVLRQLYYAQWHFWSAHGVFANKLRLLGVPEVRDGKAQLIVGPHTFVAGYQTRDHQQWWITQDGRTWKE
ncbi:MAG: carbohydrate-binding family 9-like protein [candidate division KSB1 bacterium]|nr:carbohydrate-binding family 9-like protein [candidate division KSB1 bacterium]MDZ7414021.1 carbohydrate-binding family 9-like protein [candidate division KSB1 bacterium]